MPYVNTYPSAGPLRVRYTISTPACCDAPRIDPSLPTVVFLHPVFMASEVWHAQFTDPALRTCNLVALDLRLWGQTEGDVSEGYSFSDGAEDVACFMEALDLPPSFIVGASLGSSVAIHLAVLYPTLVLGLFLISPLSAWEPEHVGAGRKEIYEVWWEANQTGNSDLLKQAAMGGLQLMFNNKQRLLIQRLTKTTFNYGLQHARSPGRLEMLRYVSCDLFTDRVPLSREKLALIHGPVVMVHAAADIAYPEDIVREKEKAFVEADVAVEFISIKGAPHFAHVTHGPDINPLLAKLIRSHSDLPVFGGMPDTVSPFFEKFALCSESEDDDEDD